MQVVKQSKKNSKPLLTDHNMLFIRVGGRVNSMNDLHLNIDISSLASEFSEVAQELEQDLVSGVQGLASMTHAKVLELASDELKSLSQKYKENVDFTNPENNLWIVTLREPAMFIEEGMQPGFMRQLLNGRSSKTNNKGERYATIPFEHVKETESTSNKDIKPSEISDLIKKELRSRKIPFRKIETDRGGQPKLGLIRKLNIASGRPSANANYDTLHGLNIYQMKTKSGTIKKHFVTFRVIKESHEAEGKWFQPGKEGIKLLDKALEWAERYWESDLLPQILDQYR